MKRFKLLFVFFGILLFTTGIFAQKKVLKKANELFKTKNYSEAIPLYESAIAERTSISSMSKLAYCFRMTNKMDRAEELYAAIVLNPKAKSETYFYYGEALMSNEKYGEAKSWFEKYTALEPDDERGKLMSNACDQVPFIQPLFEFVVVEEYPFNSEMDDSSPIFFEDGIVFSSDRKQGVKVLKQKTGWTGRDFLKLYHSRLDETGNFKAPQSFSAKLNELNKNTSNFSCTEDKTKGFITRNGILASRKNTYNMQLYEAESINGSKWKNVQLLPFCNIEYNYMHPSISPNGEELFFISNKPKGQGGTDIYSSKKTDKGWSKPQNLGPLVNSIANEGFPFIHTDGKLYFCSKGHVGYGGFDIFYTERDKNGVWQQPINVGKPINSSYDDISFFLKRDGLNGLFSSSRNGGDDDIYLFNVSDRPIAVNPVSVKKETTPSIPMVDPAYEEKNVETSMDVNVKKEVEESIEIKEKVIVEVATEKEKEKNKDSILPKKEAEVGTLIIPEETGLVVEDTEDDTTLIVSDETLLVKESKENIEETSIISASTENDILVNSTEKNTTILQEYDVFKVGIGNQSLAQNDRYLLSGVNFMYNKAELLPNSKPQLDELADLLKTSSSIALEIGYHTSSKGDDAENLQLSQERAEAIHSYLVGKGIAQERLEAKGFGETMLLNDCINGISCSMAEHSENIRIELKVTKR